MPTKVRIIMGKRIDIKGSMARHKIVKKVVNSFIATEYRKKARGVVFKYPVENLPEEQLYISRPGHKKNFDFKVEVKETQGIGGGSHGEITEDIKRKEEENQKAFVNFMSAMTEIYDCSENDVDVVLGKHPKLSKVFKSGAKVEVILKIVKWLFIMEDIIYWDNEGRAFLFNFLRYVTEESNEDRLREAFERKVDQQPDSLKRYMKKAEIQWIPSKG